MPTIRTLATASTLLVLFAAPLTAQKKDAAKDAPEQPSTLEKAIARYRECIQRVPFVYHTEGRMGLSSTRKPEALRQLANDYAKPQAHPEYTRYTIARMLGMHFANADSVAELDALREAHAKPVDTWLWFHALRVKTDYAGDAEAIEVATTSKSLVHRAAAILALGHSRQGGIKTAIITNCLEWPKKEAERAVLLGAMSSALRENGRRVTDPDYRDALKAYISLLATEVGLTHTLKIQIARHLQKILRGPALFVNPEPWLEILERGNPPPKPDQRTRATQRFFGIETDGERFCYVLDMSDSMCQPISPSAKPPATPTTGPRKKQKGAVLDESDLPWHKIVSRWDLAREQMRISLSRLTDDKHFSIVWFGTESGTLDACKGMVKATKANVDRVMAELDAIVPGGKDERVAPYGRLRGKTNLHSGLRRALSLSDKGYVEEAAYVDAAVLAQGCDTIFLLSDGAPSWDDFNVLAKDYGEGKVVYDSEYGVEAPRTPEIHYFGPYDQDEWLVEDFKRMNAFRQIRMHCIGLGEANMALLRQLAQAGHGEWFEFGRKTENKTGKDSKGSGAR